MTRWRVTASACVLAVALSATTGLAEDVVEIAPPELPDVVVELGEAPAPAYDSHVIGVRILEPEAKPDEAQTTASLGVAPSAPAIDIPPPDLPQPELALRAEPPAALPDIRPPDLPQPGLALSTEFAAFIAERAPLVGTIAPRLPPAERKALTAFYEARAWQPLWIADGAFSDAAKRLAARLDDAPAEGLFGRDYPLPALETASASAMAEAEVKLSALAVLYARDARGGRLEPRRLSNLITPKLDLPGADEVLARLVAASDPGAALQAYNPPHAGYAALRAKLAEIRGDRTPAEPMVRIPEGPSLKLGMRDSRVALIRARLNLGPSDEPVYDRELARAVTEFQRNAGLPANGVASRTTLDAMESPTTTRSEGDLIAQMERWRWLPADLGDRHIMVNIPEFVARLVHQGVVEHQTRVIVGKPETPTPIFSHVMDQVVLNPSWFVPPSILRKEFLPRLASDPDYAARRGYVVSRGRNGAISVRQPPGERNALGHIKFLFPNEHAVYLHDTPSRHLFSSERRAFSHGCVRVDQPMKLGELLLGAEEGWTERRLRSLVGSGERTIRLANPLRIHLTYMTHVVGANGELQTFADLYGFHRLVRSALGLRG